MIRPEGIPVEVQVRSGQVADGILEAARSSQATLIALATHS
jgi:nucleotide-binding universal stress UspA family protein